MYLFVNSTPLSLWSLSIVNGATAITQLMKFLVSLDPYESYAFLNDHLEAWSTKLYT